MIQYMFKRQSFTLSNEWSMAGVGMGEGGAGCLQLKGSRVNALRNLETQIYHTLDLICNCVCCTFYVGGLWKGEVGRGGGEG